MKLQILVKISTFECQYLALQASPRAIIGTDEFLLTKRCLLNHFFDFDRSSIFITFSMRGTSWKFSKFDWLHFWTEKRNNLLWHILDQNERKTCIFRIVKSKFRFLNQNFDFLGKMWNSSCRERSSCICIRTQIKRHHQIEHPSMHMFS